MQYERITVTQQNAEWAIRENLYRIYETIASKLQQGGLNRIEGLNAAGKKVYQVADAVDDTDAVNLRQVKQLLGI